MRFGTWNVRSLHRAGAVILVVHIKMDMREVGYDPGDWIALAEDRDQWRAYVRAVMNLGFLESL